MANPGDHRVLLYGLVGCGGLLLVSLCALFGVGVYLYVAKGGVEGGLPFGNPVPDGDGGRTFVATVTRVDGTKPAPVGAQCRFTVERHELGQGRYWCRTQLVCGDELLYGGPSSGYFPCVLYDSGRGDVVGRDDETTLADTDPSFEIDSIRGTLKLADDDAGAHGVYSLEARIEGR